MFVVKDLGNNNHIDIPESVLTNSEGSLTIKASNCSVVVGRDTTLRNLLVIIEGEAKVKIGKQCVLGGRVVVKSANAHLLVGSKTTWMNVSLSFHEAGSISMGNDCMLSGDIRLDVSDMHSIIDAKTGNRINPAADIILGEHVWVGQGAFITKGVRIGTNAIIGARSVVTKDVPDGTLVVGVPARVIKQGVTWDRRRL